MVARMQSITLSMQANNGIEPTRSFVSD